MRNVRWTLAIIGLTIAPAAVRAQTWQTIDVQVDASNATQLTDRLTPPGPDYFATAFIAELDDEVRFWQLRSAVAGSKRPVLTASFFEDGSQSVRHLMMRLALRPQAGQIPFYQSEDLTVIDPALYSLILMKKGQSLASVVAKMARKRFRTEFSISGEKQFRQVPVVNGVHLVLKERIVVPLDWKRFEAISASLFRVEVGGQNYEYVGAETSFPVENVPCLVLRHCPPTPGPADRAKYKKIILVERRPHIGEATAESCD